MAQPELDLDRVKDILSQALEHETEDQKAFVRTACDGNVRLEREVLSLLDQDTGPTPSLNQPLFELLQHPDADERRIDLTPGLRIGPYEIVRPLDEGGMGVVVLARRADDFEKQVALKVIKPGMLNDEVLRRFHNERQILAFLEHPSIARILDGGTTAEGLPYFVMEYVEGERIDAYCRINRLTLHQRVELFRQLCSALQVAHRNLVVHRDLKPSNILVTAEGVPKLLDFGIAKRLTPEASAEITRLAQSPMTLKYASPEQVNRTRPISTASDIYALGLLLYEALTDQFPYGASTSKNEPDLVRAICEEEPQRPSLAVRVSETTLGDTDTGHPRLEQRRLRRQIAGDLDSIVLKALAKDPDDRYGSVEQMADDLERYLDGRPVHAREGTRLYRLGKYLQRNRAQLGAAVVIFGLLVGMVYSQVQASLESQRAVAADEQSEFMREFLNDLFLTLNPDRMDKKTITIDQLLAVGHQRIEVELANSESLAIHKSAAQLLRVFGRTHKDFGHLKQAEEVLESAVASAEKYFGKYDETTLWALNNYASLFYLKQNFETAEELYRKVLNRRIESGKQTAIASKNLAGALVALGRFVEAKNLYQEAIDIRESDRVGPTRDVARSYRDLANYYLTTNDLKNARHWIEKALQEFKLAEDTTDQDLSVAYATLGRLERQEQRFERAKVAFDETFKLRSKRYDGMEGHKHFLIAKIDVASIVQQSDPARSMEMLDEVLEVLRVSNPANFKQATAEAEMWKGRALTLMGRYEEAQPLLERSQKVLQGVRSPRSIYNINALTHLVELYKAWGKPEDAARFQTMLDEVRHDHETAP